MFSAEHQSARMTKITNDGLTRSGTGCFTAVPIWQQWASKGYCRSITVHGHYTSTGLMWIWNSPSISTDFVWTSIDISIFCPVWCIHWLPIKPSWLLLSV